MPQWERRSETALGLSGGFSVSLPEALGNVRRLSPFRDSMDVRVAGKIVGVAGA